MTGDTPDLPPTVYVPGGDTHRVVSVHTDRACKQLDNPQTHAITAVPPASLADGDRDLPTRHKWCGTCALGHLYGTGVPARDILIEADPEDIPP